jgi:DNA-binding MarR family transcriptional regulator
VANVQNIINSPIFKNEHHKAVISLVYLGNIIDYYIGQVTSRFGISTQQYNALRIIGTEHPNPVTIGYVRSRMTYKMSDVSRIIDRLHKAGLVQRLTSKTDRRAADVVATGKGMEVLAGIGGFEKEIFRATQHLAPEEVQTLNLLLDKIADEMSR